MSETADNAKDAVLAEFLDLWVTDRDRGAIQPLAVYQLRFPGHEALVSRAYHGADPGEPTSDACDTRPAGRATDATHAIPGTDSTLGHYRLIEELGRGGFGVVWRAQDMRLGREVALKILKGLGPATGEVYNRFKREAAIAASLRHPSLCAVLDVGLDRGTPFIVMELLDGETLRDKITTAKQTTAGSSATVMLGSTDLKSGEPESVVPEVIGTVPQAWAQLARILETFEASARALHAAHEAGVIHRDIKPANIMVVSDGRPVIMDFGLARSEDVDLESLTQSGDFFGTPEYMSPEQLTRHNIKLDRRTDVWSLGVALYESLTLRRPFQSPTRQALFKAIMGQEIPDPRKVNRAICRDLKVVLQTALEKNLARRYQTAEDLAEELRRVREFRPIKAQPASALLRLRRWAQRSPAVATALGSLVLALALCAHFLVRVSEAKDLAATREVKTRESLTDWGRLADGRHLDDLLSAADALWPANSMTAPDMLEWQRKAEELVSRLPEHRAALAAIRETALPYSGRGRAKDRRTRAAEWNRIDKIVEYWERASSCLRWPALRAACQSHQSDPSRSGHLESSDETGCMEDREFDEDLATLKEESDACLGFAFRIEERWEPLRKLEDEAESRILRLAILPSALALMSVPPTREVLQHLSKHESHVMFESALRSWIREQRAEQFAKKLEPLGADRETVRERAASWASTAAALREEIGAQLTWEFSREEDQFRHDKLLYLVRGLGRLAGPPSPGRVTIIEMRDRYERASTLRRRTINQHHAAWDRCREDMSRSDSRYRGQPIAPQEGLVPLGIDWASGLWEFWHVQSGGDPAPAWRAAWGGDSNWAARPDGDPRGQMQSDKLTAGMGMVLVLVPAFDPDTNPLVPFTGDLMNRDTFPPAKLEAFFMSKYEMTQGQWKRIARENPSQSKSGHLLLDETTQQFKVTELHPVTRVSWVQGKRMARRLDLLLPTEAQWEYACRAGTRTRYWCGEDVGSINDTRAGNIADATIGVARARYAPSAPPLPWRYHVEFSDGYIAAAPIGCFSPNGFGLCDVIGNLREWCQDRYVPANENRSRQDQETGVREDFPGESDRPKDPTHTRVVRGGSFRLTARFAGSAFRSKGLASAGRDDLGLRLCRSVREDLEGAR